MIWSASCRQPTFRLSALQPPDEDYVNVYGIDITARKRAEEEREATIELLERLIESAPLGIAVLRGPEHRAVCFCKCKVNHDLTMTIC